LKLFVGKNVEVELLVTEISIPLLWKGFFLRHPPLPLHTPLEILIKFHTEPPPHPKEICIPFEGGV